MATAKEKKAAAEATLKKLEEAKKKFAEAQKKLTEKKQMVTKAKRTLATGDKKISTLEKKIEDTKSAPEKATEMLLKKAEEMEEKAAAMEAEQEKILKDAAAVEEKLAKKEAELAAEKEKADKKLEELGIPKGSTRAVSSGSASEKRKKNNFQYRLKSKGWEMNLGLSGRIESASKYGLTVKFDPEEFVATGGSIEGEFKHPYGEGCLTAIAQIVKDHGEGVEDE